ncbi:DUF1492 domain-containing protein [[Eubacterium] siraeum]|mgnify:FL=1|jgi:3-methyladenine DNA glycosylase/8-oxoguanine DNA glycosylase|nr:MAG TPA: Protein of unknown function (DUF1492) [Caudoviricetes sp.]DAZ06090.1 MAG TPA: Protein of unknown function (DUF1492) [Caudoviricetes sp.]
MTAKEYLGQAYRIDQRINSKMEQIASLNLLAQKATTVFSDMPGNTTRNIHRMEDVIIKIVDMESEINADIDSLVDLKKEIAGVIRSVSNLEYQTLLELRYLCFKTWEQIAVQMGYGIDNIYKMHHKALREVTVPETLQ